jgi:hypothetical protein
MSSGGAFLKMINIYLFNFSKKDNSTARPSTDTGTRLRCAVKTGSSIVSPVVEISVEDLPGYNYAYIPNFNRWYFITNITYERGVWILSLACDVLASYKDEIGATSMYFERASAGQNVRLKDGMFPVTGSSTVQKDVIKYGNLVGFNTGSIVVTVLSKASASGLSTYVFTSATEFYNFCDSLMATGTDSSESVWDSVTESIKITTFDPIRYIGSVLWFPHEVKHSNNAITSLKLGNFTATGFTCYRYYTASSPQHITYTITVPKHPQATARGKWVNLAPCTEYELQIPPFGTVSLDTTALMDAASISVNILPDPFTGMGRCIITTDTNASLADLAGQYGVPVQITSMVNMNYGSAITSAISAGMGTAAAILGDIPGAISGAVNTVQGIGDMIKGTVSTSGSTGSIIDHQTDIVLYSRFFTVADDDNANMGRPYCAKTTPATLTGYMVAQKGLVQSAQATRPELDAVNAYMEGGFYFE